MGMRASRSDDLRGTLPVVASSGAHGSDSSVAWRCQRAEAMAPLTRECPYVRLWARRLPRLDVGIDVHAFIQLMDSTSTATLSHRTGAWRLITRPHDKHRRKWPAP